MRARLIVIWDTGEKEVHEYDSLEKAREIESGMKVAFGNQISWTGIVERTGG